MYISECGHKSGLQTGGFMFSLEERTAAVKQLIQYDDLQYTKTIRKLGYPTDRRTLK